MREDNDAATALAGAALYAGVTQVVAFLVLVLKHGFVWPCRGSRLTV